MNKKILVIDDDALVLKSVTMLLAKNGYESTACGTARAAIEIFQNEKFDLIISDVRMAVQNGIEALSEIRAIEINKGDLPVPVIIVTGYSSERTPIDAIKLGVHDYLLKPFNVEELLASIKRAFLVKSEAVTLEYGYDVVGFGGITPFGFLLDEIFQGWNDFFKKKYLQVLRIENFNPLDFFSEKQLHNVDLNSIYVASASRKALQNSGLNVHKTGSEKYGVVVGTSISIAVSMGDFEESVCRDGNRRSKIGIFPNTVMCAPASRVSIFENITGSNTTVSSGNASGAYALAYACDLLEQKGVSKIICAASESFDEKIMLGIKKELRAIDGKIKSSFSQSKNMLIGEGALAFIVQSPNAQEDVNQIYLRILSYKTAFYSGARKNILKRTSFFQDLVCQTVNHSINNGQVDAFIITSQDGSADFEIEKNVAEALSVGAQKKIFGIARCTQHSFSLVMHYALLLSVGFFRQKLSRELMSMLCVGPLCGEGESINRIAILQALSSGHCSVIIVARSKQKENK